MKALCSDTIRSFVEAGRYLLRQAGLDTAEDEARRVAFHVWNLEAADLMGSGAAEPVIDLASRTRFFEIVRARAAGRPLQYLLGTVGFYDHDFDICQGVLIPRPETEILVDKALAAVAANKNERLRVVELCCGSGAAGLSVLAKLPGAWLLGTDISADALGLAQKNAEKLGLSGRSEFIHSDLFAAITDAAAFDLIVCNPPYVSDAEYAELDAGVRDFEPAEALLGGADGLDFYRRIIPAAERFLKHGASIIFEIGASQKEAVCELARQAGWCARIEAYPDLNGRDRVVELVKGGTAE